MTQMTPIAQLAAWLLTERPPDIQQAEMQQLAALIDDAYERAVGYSEDLDEQVKLAMIAQIPSREARFVFAQAYASQAWARSGCDPELIQSVVFEALLAAMAPRWNDHIPVDPVALQDGGLKQGAGWNWRGRLGRVRPVEVAA